MTSQGQQGERRQKNEPRRHVYFKRCVLGPKKGGGSARRDQQVNYNKKKKY